jgi:hypothetical protein
MKNKLANPAYECIKSQVRRTYLHALSVTGGVLERVTNSSALTTVICMEMTTLSLAWRKTAKVKF